MAHRHHLVLPQRGQGAPHPLYRGVPSFLRNTAGKSGGASVLAQQGRGALLQRQRYAT